MPFSKAAQHCRGQLAADEVQLLLWQILHVLKYLHANNVWHRDLKSANVLVKLENGQRIVKVPYIAVHHQPGLVLLSCLSMKQVAVRQFNVIVIRYAMLHCAVPRCAVLCCAVLEIGCA